MRSKLFIFVFFLPTLIFAKAGYWEPWGKDSDLKYIEEKAEEEPPADKWSLGVAAAEKIIWFHQNIISPVDGPRSHFKPSSSSYMLQAIQNHGLVKGFVLGCDRLLRENSDPWVYRTIEAEGKLFKYDPPPEDY